MKTYIFSGHAQLPEGTDIYENFKYVSFLAEVDMATGRVINCEVPVYFQGSNDFIANIVIGKCLDTDIPAIIAEIEYKMHTLSKRALITAIQTVYNRYINVKQNAMNKEQL